MADPIKPIDWSIHPKVGGALAGVYLGDLIVGLLEDYTSKTLSAKTAGAIMGLSTFAVAYIFPGGQQ